MVATWFSEQERWQHLLNYIKEKKWREVFLIKTEQLINVDHFLRLMKLKIDDLAKNDKKIQSFLSWANKQASNVNSNYKISAVRALYFSRFRNIEIDIQKFLQHIEYGVNQGIFGTNSPFDFRDSVQESIKSIFLITALKTEIYMLFNHDILLFSSIENNFISSDIFALNIDIPLQRKLKSIYNEIPDTNLGALLCEQWWATDAKLWMEQLNQIISEIRNISYQWNFSSTQIENLQFYYDANKILIDCLNSDCNIGFYVKEEISNTLLLPLIELEKTKDGIVEQEVKQNKIDQPDY